MKIAYEDLIFCEFIDELERYKIVINKKEYIKVKQQIVAEIEEEANRATAIMEGLEIYEQDSIISDFQEYEAEKIIEYYNLITSYFQKAYAIFENQIAKAGMGKLFDFKLYPKIEAMNNVVNVLKHGKDGRSYKALKATNSKYLQLPTEFLSLTQMPAQAMLDIIASKYAGEILNLKNADIIEFLDEAINAWKDILNANKEKRDGITGTT